MIAPITIEIVIHYYVTSGSDFKESKAFREYSEMLVEAGLLKKSLGENEFEANMDACNVYINALCNVPLPTQEWIIKQ